ncbi:MAG: L,D-transpeptidase family protein [Chthoniobacteraceae bacterium]
MLGISIRAIRSVGLVIPLLCASTRAQETQSPPPATEILISAADQRLVLLRDGMALAKFKVSTSKFGVGDRHGSFKTPLGKLRVAEKIGGALRTGSVIKHRNPTGEILPVNSPGRDPIVTRIIWLAGCEERNKNAKARGIYIHGTVEESKLGQPVSYGCIRMRSTDVVDLFEQVPIGTSVTIQEGKLSRYRKWSPPAPVVIAAKKSEPEIKRATSAATPEPVKVAVATTRAQTAEPPEPAPAARQRAKKRKAAATDPSEIAAATTKTPSDPGAAAALEGSILFKGLSDQPSESSIVKKKSRPPAEPVAKDPAPVVAEPAVAFRTQGAASLRKLERRPR